MLIIEIAAGILLAIFVLYLLSLVIAYRRAIWLAMKALLYLGLLVWGMASNKTFAGFVIVSGIIIGLACIVSSHARQFGLFVLYLLGLNPAMQYQLDAAGILNGEEPKCQWDPETLENLRRAGEIIAEGKSVDHTNGA